MRLHLGYGDIIYENPSNKNLNQKFERIQCNAALTITVAMKGTLQGKLHVILGFVSLNFKCWFRKLCTFYKIKTNRLAEYLFILFLKPIIYMILVHVNMLPHFTAGLMFRSIPSYNTQY